MYLHWSNAHDGWTSSLEWFGVSSSQSFSITSSWMILGDDMFWKFQEISGHFHLLSTGWLYWLYPIDWTLASNRPGFSWIFGELNHPFWGSPTYGTPQGPWTFPGLWPQSPWFGTPRKGPRDGAPWSCWDWCETSWGSPKNGWFMSWKIRVKLMGCHQGF